MAVTPDNPPLASASELPSIEEVDLQVGFIGAGAAGTGLAAALTAAGYHVAQVHSRSLPSAQRLAAFLGQGTSAGGAQATVDGCNLVFLTVPDSAIATVAAEVRWRRGQIVAHCSGALGPEALVSAAAQGAVAVAFHPLCSFIKGRVGGLSPGTRFAFTGPEQVRPIFESLAVRLHGVLLDLPAQGRARYHAAAVMASNYLVALAAIAAEVLATTGFDRNAALEALLPLMRSSIDNLQDVGLPHALTGPLVRGDVETVSKHRASLRDTCAGASYDTLACATARFALERSDLAPDAKLAIRRVLREVESTSKNYVKQSDMLQEGR